MKNTLIVVLVIALVIIGGVLYFYRDAIFGASHDTSKVASEAIEEIKEDAQEGIEDIKEGFEDVKDTMRK